MFSMNKVFLAGNLTRDPENKSTANGVSICEFGIAVNRKIKDRDETCYINVTVFGKQAEACSKYLSKGSNVFIDGRLVYESWSDKTGAKRTSIKVVAEMVQFISNRGGEESADHKQPRIQANAAPPVKQSRSRYTAEDYPENANNGEEELPPF